MCGCSDGGVCYVSERVLCVCGRSDGGVCYVSERVVCVVVVMMVFVMSVSVWCVLSLIHI